MSAVGSDQVLTTACHICDSFQHVIHPFLNNSYVNMFKAIALAALAALMGADAFVSPVATSFSGSAVATQRVRTFTSASIM